MTQTVPTPSLPFVSAAALTPTFLDRVISQTLLPLADKIISDQTVPDEDWVPSKFTFLHALDALDPLLKQASLGGEEALGHVGALTASPFADAGQAPDVSEAHHPRNLSERIHSFDEQLIRAGLGHTSCAASVLTVPDSDPAPRVYLAGKTWRAPIWRWLAGGGSKGLFSVNATWPWLPGALPTRLHAELWARCVDEASRADFLCVIARPGDVLKGTMIEIGAALANGVPVYQVGVCNSLKSGDGSDASFVSHPLWRVAESPWDAAIAFRTEFLNH